MSSVPGALTFRSAATGWGPPNRDQVLASRGATCFLTVGGAFYESGLYAHAPSRYVLNLSGQWKRLVGSVGLQDGNNGSVVFVVRGDGKEHFRSPVIKDHRPHKLDVDITGIKTLELIVEDAGDTNRSDWGVWLGPELRR